MSGRKVIVSRASDCLLIKRLQVLPAIVNTTNQPTLRSRIGNSKILYYSNFNSHIHDN
jgi:hypothetical protein